MNTRQPLLSPRYLGKNLALILFALCYAISTKGAPPTSRHSPKAQTKRLTVIDYYYLYPYFGTSSKPDRREKKQSLQSRYRPIIDLKHDFLEVQPDSAPREQFAVFRARGKADLLAVSMPDYKSDYNLFGLYQLQNGHLREVTRQELPVPVRIDSFLYELPRIGTTIRVFRFNLERGTRQHAFDLQWRQGRFVKVP